MTTIGLFSRWNATCGISVHAEFIGREFIKMGYKLKVFAPYINSANKWWHHKVIREDEDYVIRCYSELDPIDMKGGKVDENKIIAEDLDWLIVESYSCIPYKDVENLIIKLRNRGVKVVAVIHEGSYDEIKYSSLRIFDAVVVFDERYKEMLSQYEDIIEIIPYPCHPVKRGKRKFSEDILTFFSFGRQPIKEYEYYIKALDDLSSKYDFIYKVVRSDGLLPFKREWLKQEQKRLDIEEIYKYLHSSDIHLLPKSKTEKVVVSSTLFQCLGSLVPTIAPDTRYFEALPEINGVKPVILYKDVKDLENKLIMIIEDKEYRKRVIKAAEKFVEENRVDKVAKKFIELFEKL